MSKWINEKIEQGIIKKKIVHGASPILAQEKKDKVGMRPLVDLIATNENTIKKDKTIPDLGVIRDSLGRV